MSAARSGDPIIELQFPNGDRRPLHSRYEPLEEARSLLPETIEPLCTLLFLGPGLGHAVRESLDRLSTQNRILWVEPDARLFRTLLGYVDISRIATRHGVQFLVGADGVALRQHLAAHVAEYMASPLKLIQFPSTQALAPEHHESYRTAVREFTVQGAVTVRTTFYLSRFSTRNEFANLRYYAQSPGVAPLKGILKNKPAILVAAGPSLQRNIAYLKRAQGKVTIISVSTTLRRLLAEGIVPDLTVLIDYHDISRRYFEDIDPAVAPPMICELGSSKAAVAAYSGPHTFGSNALMNTLFDGIFGDKGSLPPGSTVAHIAFNVAAWMGASPIILVGQDLSYPGGMLHVPGTAEQLQDFPLTNRFYSFESRELEYYLANRKEYKQVAAIPDGTAPICDIFFTYLKEFESMFTAYAGEVIDATEGGARIAGTEVATLSEVLDRYPDAVSPDLREIDRLAREAMQENGTTEKLANLLVQRKEELLELRELYGRMTKHLEHILDRNEKGKNADRRVIKVQKLNERAQKFGKLYLVLSRLAQGDMWERIRKDRLLDAGDDEGVERQLQQAERDLSFVRGLFNATNFIEGCLTLAEEVLEAERPEKLVV